LTGRSGNLVNATTTLRCQHGGRIIAAAASGAVRVDGQAVRTAGDVFTVRGCPRTVDGTPDPCITVRWSPERDSVLVDGVPVLLDSTDGQCFSAVLRPQGRPTARTDSRGVTCR
jgi:hypothetical protein